MDSSHMKFSRWNSDQETVIRQKNYEKPGIRESAQIWGEIRVFYCAAAG
jgi:hypothetical protein